jgi:hypothetical protein
MNMKKITEQEIQQLERDIAEMQEVIYENKLHKSVRNAAPGIAAVPALNNNNDPYLAYQFGVRLAGAPAKSNAPIKGPVGGNFITIAYTDGDDQILKAAAKEMGINSKSMGSSKRSTELDDVHKASPVANKKRNKYGI